MVCQGKEVGRLAYLGGGMPLESQARVGLRHALAVVYHLYGGAPGINHQHMNVVSSGVYGILNQLLNYRSRTLYHLASRYLVGY